MLSKIHSGSQTKQRLVYFVSVFSDNNNFGTWGRTQGNDEKVLVLVFHLSIDLSVHFCVDS